MDTFMDKLAQKLTAQEMIKANAAADAEELSKLQNQVKEYNECLSQMCAVNQQMRENAKRMEHLMEEEIAPAMDRLAKEQVVPEVNRLMEQEIVPQMNRISEEVLGRMEGMQSSGDQIRHLVEESMDKLGQMQQDQDAYESLQKSLAEMFEQSDDYVHKENVKVYRNVQAVVVEESARQKEILEQAVKAVSGRMNAVLGVAVAALAAGAGSLVFQILVYFHVI